MSAQHTASNSLTGSQPNLSEFEEDHTVNRVAIRKRKTLMTVKARRGLTTADISLDGAARPIYLNEHLAPHMLYSKTRKLGLERGYTYIWMKDCKIFLRKNDSSKPMLIATEEDLAKIK
ncbi:unnamed protein product [Arctia plantaginis]|uniref:FP protein C-terminal domain-containing protein n=1 Tax=Arctia plantaginis TaxID=874455 RepID=A0A8S1A605_ARCPL|nr:unnamed protein product [Arctia plantaginis]